MLTVVRQRTVAQGLCLAAAALSAVLATGSIAVSSADPAPVAPCYNGVAPLNPYVDNCAIPARPPHILGAAPDQTAILNCSVGGSVWRAVCLSQYVNGGPAPYPGVILGIGGR